jgi:endonuclease/exonuclease/phosphatase (EEP) superfamily protein YafD
MRLDHVLLSADSLAATDVGTVGVRGTDHRGVLATIAFR